MEVARDSRGSSVGAVEATTVVNVITEKIDLDGTYLILC